MYPYDKNRVQLPVVGKKAYCLYINRLIRRPLASTRADFWSMIWEQNVGVVAMVTNLVEESMRKCFQYWPISSENDCQYSDYTIRLLSEETYANFVVRTLHCTKVDDKRVNNI
ncbi:tyrosine-protein phosphatase non-receptor type 9-like [Dreissena polymorpha]|uniref:tyrosine-protein phosphatase non-receptor type 9-like n=1 Tax=Dreissena polymorpha TaxID=45954 RepID=UPI002264BC44|nr:tyrosine-protein phosphatase non-receptor type 9-like [Dreissena polymorpha]